MYPLRLYTLIIVANISDTAWRSKQNNENTPTPLSLTLTHSLSLLLLFLLLLLVVLDLLRLSFFLLFFLMFCW
jgi:hypothetical protein